MSNLIASQFKLTPRTRKQIRELCDHYGGEKMTYIVKIAIDRLYREDIQNAQVKATKGGE